MCGTKVDPLRNVVNTVCCCCCPRGREPPLHGWRPFCTAAAVVNVYQRTYCSRFTVSWIARGMPPHLYCRFWHFLSVQHTMPVPAVCDGDVFVVYRAMCS